MTWTLEEVMDRQLARVAEKAQAVYIYNLDRAFPVWMWLCEKHLTERKAAGWMENEKRTPKHPLVCDDCKAAEDWHGVRDAAADLGEIDAALKVMG